MPSLGIRSPTGTTTSTSSSWQQQAVDTLQAQLDSAKRQLTALLRKFDDTPAGNVLARGVLSQQIKAKRAEITVLEGKLATAKADLLRSKGAAGQKDRPGSGTASFLPSGPRISGGLPRTGAGSGGSDTFVDQTVPDSSPATTPAPSTLTDWVQTFTDTILPSRGVPGDVATPGDFDSTSALASDRPLYLNPLLWVGAAAAAGGAFWYYKKHKKSKAKHGSDE